MSRGRRVERPDASELLKLAQTRLREDVLPALSGASRYQALLIANALGIAGREIRAGRQAWETLESDLRELLVAPGVPEEELSRRLAVEIRGGDWDAREDLHKTLSRHVEARLAIANPRALASKS